MSTPTLYVATMGHTYLYCENGFYPPDISDDDRLAYYASKFDSIMIRTTFFGQPKIQVYNSWLQSVEANPSFKFIICAPKILSYAKNIKDVKSSWNFFWNGNNIRGGCKLLHSKLGCILIEFSRSFYYTLRNMNRIKAIMTIIPKDVKCAVEFRHSSWWEHYEQLKDTFETQSNWCITTPYVENGLVSYGWAGNLPSTRVQSNKETIPTIFTTDFIMINFYGTMGPHLGSYDCNSFLERLVVTINKYQENGIKTIYCSFNNTNSSYCYPLPSLYVMGWSLRPKMKELSPLMETDLPCCLHDALRLAKIWHEIAECPYQTDERGNIQMVFV